MDVAVADPDGVVAVEVDSGPVLCIPFTRRAGQSRPVPGAHHGFVRRNEEVTRPGAIGAHGSLWKQVVELEANRLWVARCSQAARSSLCNDDRAQEMGFVVSLDLSCCAREVNWASVEVSQWISGAWRSSCKWIDLHIPAHPGRRQVRVHSFRILDQGDFVVVRGTVNARRAP
ncbi:MAG: hypothetical protein OEW45_13580 [Deltaproteobacteria bacterium]|nr:hypothetical protein [Deltaproteobacteria bacterium]